MQRPWEQLPSSKQYPFGCTLHSSVRRSNQLHLIRGGISNFHTTMADRDILFAVRNNYYLGAYQNAINEASDLEGLADQEQIERDSFVYRSYIASGSYEVHS